MALLARVNAVLGKHERQSSAASTAVTQRVMSAAGTSAAGTVSDAQKLQLVVSNFVQKACEMVVHARMIPLPDALRRGSVNRWFNVESEELLTLHDNLENWRLDISQPLQLDIFVDASEDPSIRSALGLQVRLPASPHPTSAARSTSHCPR